MCQEPRAVHLPEASKPDLASQLADAAARTIFQKDFGPKDYKKIQWSITELPTVGKLGTELHSPRLSSAAYMPYDLGQVTQPFCTSLKVLISNIEMLKLIVLM